MILNIPLNMVIIIFIKSQVIIITYMHISSYFIKIFKNQQKISTRNMYNIKIWHCTVGVLYHIHIFFILYSSQLMDLAYISRLNFICIIITSFKPKSSMNQHISSTYNIIIMAYPTLPECSSICIHLIL